MICSSFDKLTEENPQGIFEESHFVIGMSWAALNHFLRTKSAADYIHTLVMGDLAASLNECADCTAHSNRTEAVFEKTCLFLASRPIHVPRRAICDDENLENRLNIQCTCLHIFVDGYR